jgi:hypothetical protein
MRLASEGIALTNIHNGSLFVIFCEKLVSRFSQLYMDYIFDAELIRAITHPLLNENP